MADPDSDEWKMPRGWGPTREIDVYEAHDNLGMLIQNAKRQLDGAVRVKYGKEPIQSTLKKTDKHTYTYTAFAYEHASGEVYGPIVWKVGYSEQGNGLFRPKMKYLRSTIVLVLCFFLLVDPCSAYDVAENAKTLSTFWSPLYLVIVGVMVTELIAVISQQGSLKATCCSFFFTLVSLFLLPVYLSVSLWFKWNVDDTMNFSLGIIYIWLLCFLLNTVCLIWDTYESKKQNDVQQPRNEDPPLEKVGTNPQLPIGLEDWKPIRRNSVHSGGNDSTENDTS